MLKVTPVCKRGFLETEINIEKISFLMFLLFVIFEDVILSKTMVYKSQEEGFNFLLWLFCVNSSVNLHLKPLCSLLTLK